MCYRQIVILDLFGCNSLNELHQRIKSAFNFPNYYGENWDAFYDLLSCGCDVQKIDIIGTGTLPQELTRNISIMLRVLEDNKKQQNEAGNEFDYEVIS